MNVGVPFYIDGQVTVWAGDCLEVLAAMPAESVDAVVTDPPYGLEFMGRDWDKFRVDDRTARWSGERTGAAGDVGPREAQASADLGERLANMPSFTKTRTTAQCQTCGKRDAFRNPHPCDETGAADWRTIRVDNVPMEMRAFQAWCELWTVELFRVLKPGGHLLAFGGSRTWHRLAVAVEEAGFDVRDSIAWLYGQGFPKSLNVADAIAKANGDTALETDEGTEWEGWGTALKPAFEPIIVARKPLVGTVADNVQRYGTGAMNIGGCRVDVPGRMLDSDEFGPVAEPDGLSDPGGRWPPNVLLSEDQAELLDAQNGVKRSGVLREHHNRKPKKTTGIYGDMNAVPGARGYGDEGGVSRVFPTFRYQAKAGKAERPAVDGVAHPTVKPVELMRWLVRLVTTRDAVVLDPFAGSGTTGEACIVEGRNAVLIEQAPEYLPLIVQRVTRPLATTLDLGEL